MNWIAQVFRVTAMSLRTVPERLGATLAAAVGIAGVVAVMVAVLSIAEGFAATLRNTGSADTAMVMRSGADTEMNSGIALDDTRIIADAPGVRRGADGPMASAELFVIIDVPKRATGTDANVPLRGVQPAVYEVREEVRIVEGRRFEWGRDEVIVGIGAAQQFAGLEVGDTLAVGQQRWAIVGHFAAGGTLSESELWCDVAVLQPAFMRGNSFQSVYARLESPAAFDTFKDALTTDPRLDIQVLREADYYASQSETLHLTVTVLGAVVAILMGVGAAFGAINTMYSAVSSRTREVATLRALGFGGGPVVISVLVESLLLALAGGLVGGLGAWAAFHGYRASTINWDSFSQVTFTFAVTGELLFRGIAYALILGLVGGLFPAIRAARIPVAAALREL